MSDNTTLRKFKSFARMGKQATLLKMGKAEKLPESEEFRTAVSRYKEIATFLMQLEKNMTALIEFEKNIASTSHLFSEGLYQIADIRAEHPVAPLAKAVADGQEQLRAFRDEFVRNASAESAAALRAALEGAVQEAAAIKREYNRVRLEHDALQKKVAALEAKGAAAKKREPVEREFAEVDAAYAELQRRYIAKIAYIDQKVWRDSGIAVLRFLLETADFFEQGHHLFTALRPRLEEHDVAIRSLPLPADPAAAPSDD